ncbi:MAG: hypothetical protein ABSF25_17365 [Bryobacteraceae bacterium]
MIRPGSLRWAVLAAAALILSWQLLVPPITGIADNGDFIRMGRFGYGPKDKAPDAKFNYVGAKYVPDPEYRYPALEQFSSEYFLAGAAICATRVITNGGEMDIRLVGLVHLLAFLIALGRLLRVTERFRAAPLLWMGTLLVVTDAGYAVYFNSLYTEPASYIFFVFLLAETIAICCAERLSRRQVAVWCIWAVLFVFAKAQNAPLGILLAAFSLRMGWWPAGRTVRYTAVLASMVITSAAAIDYLTSAPLVKWANTYNMLFTVILGESRNPAADLKTLGLDPALAKFAGTGAWSPGAPFNETVESGVVGKRVTSATIAGFFLTHPLRVWRHIRKVLPVAFSLRPSYGNFERSAGKPPGAHTTSFSLWSWFHERCLGRIGVMILISLPISLAVGALAWARGRARRRIESLALLVACCLAAFAVAVFGDAWDNIKHLFLFNLLLDACLIAALGIIAAAALGNKNAA